MNDDKYSLERQLSGKRKEGFRWMNGNNRFYQYLIFTKNSFEFSVYLSWWEGLNGKLHLLFSILKREFPLS